MVAWQKLLDNCAHPHLVLLVLARIWKAGDDSRDPGGWGDLAGIDHDQQLHQIVIDLPTATLHDVDIFSSHTLAYLHAARTERWHDRLPLCLHRGADTLEGILYSVYLSYIFGELIFGEPLNKSDSRNCNANFVRAYNSQVTPRDNVWKTTHSSFFRLILPTGKEYAHKAIWLTSTG